MKKKLSATLLLFTSMFILLPSASAQTELSADTRKAMATQHEEIAKFHSELAKCLASDRPIKECQDFMTTGCTAMQGKAQMWMKGHMGGQGMMGQGMMGQGKGHMPGMATGIYGCPLHDVK